jgi:hypothetical protein
MYSYDKEGFTEIFPLLNSQTPTWDELAFQLHHVNPRLDDGEIITEFVDQLSAGWQMHTIHEDAMIIVSEKDNDTITTSEKDEVVTATKFSVGVYSLDSEGHSELNHMATVSGPDAYEACLNLFKGWHMLTRFVFQVDEENATNFDFSSYRNEVKQNFIYTGRIL